jgi:hypothetical protein
VPLFAALNRSKKLDDVLGATISGPKPSGEDDLDQRRIR